MDLAYLRGIGISIPLPQDVDAISESQPFYSKRIGYQGNTLIALLPTHPEFDEEAEQAATVMAVVRFSFRDIPQLSSKPQTPCRAIARHFMLSAERYQALYDGLAALGVHLVVTPEMYERAHYFPNAYNALMSMAPEVKCPRAAWVLVDKHTMCPDVFASTVAEISKWKCSHVMLKDFVKSAKGQGDRFMQALVDDDLSTLACELVSVRGARFNRGVVFKELKNLERYEVRGEYTTNEWRLWFGNYNLLEASPNSFQGVNCLRPPDDVLAAVTRAARQIANPYMTVDIAEDEDGWIVLEAGDGGVSGPAPNQDMTQHWTILMKCFCETSSV